MKILFIALIASFSSYIYSCEDINLYESRPETLNLEIVNQADMNTCYAHSLATHYNIEHATSKSDRAHPYWVAFNHKKRLLHWTPRNLDYSILSWAYRDLKRRGNCSYVETEAKLHELKRGVDYSNDQLIYLLKSFFKVKKKRHGDIFIATLDFVRKKSSKFEREWSLADVTTIISPLIDVTEGIGFYRYLGTQVFNHCRKEDNEKITYHLKNFARGFSSNRKVAAKLESILGDEKSVAVGYCARDFFSKKPQDRKDIDFFPRMARAIHLNCGSHYSVLVGSRKTENSCQYLLRNSYGEDFWMDESFECYCRDEISGVGKNCRKGDMKNSNLKVLGCWVDRERLLSNTFDLSYY